MDVTSFWDAKSSAVLRERLRNGWMDGWIEVRKKEGEEREEEGREEETINRERDIDRL